MTSIERFKDITNYDLESFINKFIDFSKNQQPAIDYYEGFVDNLDNSYFEQLNYLKKEVVRVQDIFTKNKNQFNDTSFWDLIDFIDDIYFKLNTITQYPKWLRTSVTRGGSNSAIELQSVLKQNQTLESFAAEVGYSDPDNDWVDIAIKNDLVEEDYEFQGGVLFKFSWQNNFRIKLETIVDVIDSSNFYGKDLNKKIVFENDDLKCLIPKDTLKQTVDILMTLLKGDNPEFPDDGIDKGMISQLNRNFNIYPSLFRQIYNTFSKEEIFKAISIKNIYKDSDSIRMDFIIETKIDEIIEQTI